MTSLTAGSPTCNCKNPDTCIHALTLKLGDNVYEYKQSDFFSSISVINDKDTPIPLTLALTGKSCVSKNPECPKGMIYDADNQETLVTFTKGTINYPVNYNKGNVNYLTSCNSIDFIVHCILSPASMDYLPYSQYILRVGQCFGDSFIEEDINFINGTKQVFNIAPHDRLWSTINIYPNYKWNIGIAIGVKEKIDEYSDDELKTQQRKENRSAGMESRGTKGWTKRPRYSITDSLDIKGTMSCQFGQYNPINFSQRLKFDFKKKYKELTLLQNSVKAINETTKLFSTGEGNGVKYKIMDSEIIFPTLFISGDAELAMDNETNSANTYMKGMVSVGFSPLIGFKTTFDLLQVFAAWYGAANITSAVRERLAAGKDSVKEGENGAYGELKCDLVISATISTLLEFQSNAEQQWHWHVKDGNEIKVAISIDANISVGANICIIEGVFSVSGEATAGATAKAEGIIAIEDAPPSGVRFTLYHNGIQAEVYGSISGGIVTNEGATGSSNRTSTSSGSISTTGKNKIEEKKIWTIYDKLEKEKSTCRFEFSL